METWVDVTLIGGPKDGTAMVWDSSTGRHFIECIDGHLDDNGRMVADLTSRYSIVRRRDGWVGLYVNEEETT